jgi:hypothetical protein
MRYPLLVCFAALFWQPSLRAAAPELPPSIVNPALAIHAALAGDSAAGVTMHAAAMARAAAALGTDGAPIAAAAQELAAAPDLAAMRRVFGDVSKAIVAYMRAHDVAAPDGIRTAYCPMARRQWLQKDGAVENPYYGRAMAGCGGFTD